MAYKWYGEKTFDMGNGFSIDCKAQRTSYGFRHWCDLKRDDWIISSGKGCYYNRTWERYTYQSAIQNAIRKATTINEDERKYLNEWATEGKEPLKEDMAIFGMAAMTAELGNLFCDTTEEKNAWKKRMIKAVPGLDFPEDFDELPEDVKQKRLDETLKMMKEI